MARFKETSNTTPSRAQTASHEAPAKGAQRMRSLRSKARKHQQPSEAPKGLFIGIAIAALVIIILVGVLACNAFNSATTANTNTQASTADAVQSWASAEEGIEYHGHTYKAVKIDGGWALVSVSGEQENVIYSFVGEPVSIVFYEGKFYIAENLSDGTWDIIGYMPMDGAMASQMLDKTGGAVTGTGTLESMGLSDTNLDLTYTSGAKTYISLL